MIGSFASHAEDRRFNWRHEVAPVLAVAGLAADYLSPPAAWTMVLPFAFVVLLIALRKWAFAAAVFLLCSWVLIPTAARAVFAVEDMRGKHDAFWIDGVALQSLDGPVADPCVPNYVGFTKLPVGPGHLIRSPGALAQGHRVLHRAPQPDGARPLAAGRIGRVHRQRRAPARRRRALAEHGARRARACEIVPRSVETSSPGSGCKLSRRGMGRELQVVSLAGVGLALVACSSRELGSTGGKCIFADPNITAEVHFVAVQHGVADQDATEILSQNVTSLEGVQCLRQLDTLDLQGSPLLIDLAPLEGHPTLATVRLASTGISDFGPLGAIPHLRRSS